MTMKLCKDCKWFSADGRSCLHESALRPDYIHGTHTHYRADIHRAFVSPNDCSPEARFYEAKP